MLVMHCQEAVKCQNMLDFHINSFLHRHDNDVFMSVASAEDQR